MKAIAYARYGGPDVMTVLDLPAPRPGANQVVVKVAAVGLNPVDAMQRGGAMKMLHPLQSSRISAETSSTGSSPRWAREPADPSWGTGWFPG
jgi:NADPH:quinone reductase-like Zn-dependent oxidoreductase